MSLSQCPAGASNKSYEIPIPKPEDQNILIIWNIFVLDKSLSCSCNRSIMLLALVSLGLGDAAIPWDTQGLLEGHRCRRKALDSQVRLQNSRMPCRPPLTKALCK